MTDDVDNAPWLIVGTPGGIHCWPLAHDADIEAAALAARALLDVPNGSEVIAGAGTPWDVQVTYGEPHGKLLAAATVHDGAELARVDLARYRSAEVTEQRAERVRAARKLLDALDDDTKAVVLAAYARAPLPKARLS